MRFQGLLKGTLEQNELGTAGIHDVMSVLFGFV